MVTMAPCWCRRRTVASPRPDAPPTTSAPAFWMCMRGNLLARAREREREQGVVVREDVLELQAGRCEVAGEALERELRADLRAQLLARLEGDVDAERLDAHVLARGRAQAHLDPLALAVEERDVVERVDV